jgi:flagellar biosynthesis protein
MPAPDPRLTAAAIRYTPDDYAPRVVAKGRGAVAEAIIERARASGVYVHESPPLVALLMRVDLDSHIPPQLYLVIAELLVWLYRLDEDLQRGDAYSLPSAPSLNPLPSRTPHG